LVLLLEDTVLTDEAFQGVYCRLVTATTLINISNESEVLRLPAYLKFHL
jgi:hypothetical protein